MILETRISNFSFLHSCTLFVLSIGSAFKTDVFKEKSVDTSFPAMLQEMHCTYYGLYVHNGMKVLCDGNTYCIIRQKYEGSL